MAAEGQAASATDIGLPRRAVWAPAALPHDGSLELLKWLALLAMLIDHVDLLLLHLEKLSWAYHTGRLALPLFAIVLGCKLARKSRPVPAAGRAARAETSYARGLSTVKRLFVWGLISTGPYVLATGSFWPVNVFFTLGLGALACWLVDAGLRPRWKLLAAAAILLLSLACESFAPGVLLVLAAFLYGRKPGLRALAWVLLCCLGLAFLNWSAWTLLALPLAAAACLWRAKVPRVQWFFYAFYPLHLLVLAVLAALLNVAPT
jgi:hypothetical protein